MESAVYYSPNLITLKFLIEEHAQLGYFEKNSTLLAYKI